MRYYYEHDTFGPLGPYTVEELRALYRHGVIRAETPVRGEGSDETLSFHDLLARAGLLDAGRPAHRPLTTPPLGLETSFTKKAGDDLRVMLPHLMLPLAELRTFRWLESRRVLAIACIGLLPLLIYAMFGGGSQLANALWAMALYFSVLWALFFYYVFPTPEARFAPASFCFFTTGILAIAGLLQLYRIWPLSALLQWTNPGNTILTQWLGFILGVGLPEELCKALVLLFLVRRFGPFAPRAVLFYGLIAGLGFGIYEGISYQTSHNFRFAVDAAGLRDRASFAAEYYLLNLIRLTTLPFLHAMWTGTAGYFIGFAASYPERKRGLLIVALGLPALLHGSYNAFSGSALGLAFALISVLALNLYLAKSVDFERLLNARS